MSLRLLVAWPSKALPHDCQTAAMAVPKDCRQTGGPSKAPGGSRAAFRIPAVKKKREPLSELAVLDRTGVARWLGVSLRTLDRLAPPALPLGDGTKRYLMRDLLSWLQSRRNGDGRMRGVS